MIQKPTGPSGTWSSEDYAQLAADLGELARALIEDDLFAAEMCEDLSGHLDWVSQHPSRNLAHVTHESQRPPSMRPPGATF